MIAGSATWSLSDAELREAVAAGAAAQSADESAWLGLVRALDQRPQAVTGARAGFVAHTFLTHALHRGQRAGLDVNVARALDPDRNPVDGGLPRIAEAFAAGLISREHVNSAVRTAGQVPQRLKKRVFEDGQSGAEKIDTFLAAQSQQLAPRTVDQLGRHLLNILDPDGRDRFDPDGHTRRSLSMHSDQTGMLCGRFALPAAQAAMVKAALEAYSRPQPACEAQDQDGQPVLVADDRSQGQRQADALTAIAEAALAQAAERRSEPPHVVVLATPEQLAQAQSEQPDQPGQSGQSGPPDQSGQARTDPQAAGLAHCTGLGPISPSTLARLACDAVLQAVVLDESDRILYLGRKVRLASKHQRVALAARDRGCVIPGCEAAPERCEIHHVVWWSQGGPTDIDTMALLCPRHHTDVHSRVWAVRMINGVPWVRPPAWMRPHPDTLLRNTVHRARERAVELGQQLRLDLESRPPPAAPARHQPSTGPPEN